MDGTLDDLSISGVAFTTRRTLRVNDRLIFHGRFFADELHGEVRVASLRPATSPGQTVVGCRFLGLEPDSRRRIERILSGGRTRSAGGSLRLDDLREAAAGDAPPPAGWRRVFKRGE